MPMIQLTLPAGVLSADVRSGLQKTLAATLLQWEGAPDSAFFRAQAWCRIDEVPGGGFVNAEDDLPRFGSMSRCRKARSPIAARRAWSNR